MSEADEYAVVLQWLHENEDFTNQFVLEWLQTHPDLLRCLPATELVPSAPFVQSHSGAPTDPHRGAVACLKRTSERTRSEQCLYRRKDAGELRDLSQHKMFMELAKDVIGIDFSTTRVSQRVVEACIMLTRAATASIYLVDGDLLVSRLLDVTESTGHLQAEWPACSTSEAICVPVGAGIVGEVAQSGLALNIPDAYKDPRFDASVDGKRKVRTEAILCAPAKAPDGHVVGVVELRKKRSGGPFKKEDEKILVKFLGFCAIGLMNSGLCEDTLIQCDSVEKLLELGGGVFEDVSSLNAVVEKILAAALELIPCQACRVLIVDDDPPGACAQMEFSTAFEMRRPADDAANLMLPMSIEEVSGLDTAMEAASVQKPTFLCKQGNEMAASSSKRAIQSPLQSLLCMPLLDANGQSIAVVQLLNKTTTCSFNKQDVTAFKEFVPFCTVGIATAINYEREFKVKKQQSLALKMLNHQKMPTKEEVHRFWMRNTPSSASLGLRSYSFDHLSLSEDLMVTAAARMFFDLKLVDSFRINHRVLLCWVLTVKQNHCPKSYHNWRHAFGAAQTMFAMLTDGGLHCLLSDLEVLALLMAAFCCDLGAPVEKVDHSLIKLYIAKHQFDNCISTLSDERSNILSGLNLHDYTQCITMLESAIHFSDQSHLTAKIETFSKLALAKSFEWSCADHRSLLRGMTLVACEVSAMAKPFELHKRATLESLTVNLHPEQQVKFIDSFCTPLLKALRIVHASVDPLLKGVLENRGKWLESARDVVAEASSNMSLSLCTDCAASEVAPGDAPIISTEETSTKEYSTPHYATVLVKPCRPSVATTSGTRSEQHPPTPLNIKTTTSSSKGTNLPITQANVQGSSASDVPPPPLDPVIVVIQGNPPKKSVDASFKGNDDVPPPLSPSTSIASSQHIYESITSTTPQWFESISDLYEEITPAPVLDSTLEGPGPPIDGWTTPEYQEVGKKRRRKKRNPARAILRAPIKMVKKVKKMVKKKLH